MQGSPKLNINILVYKGSISGCEGGLESLLEVGPSLPNNIGHLVGPLFESSSNGDDEDEDKHEDEDEEEEEDEDEDGEDEYEECHEGELENKDELLMMRD